MNQLLTLGGWRGRFGKINKSLIAIEIPSARLDPWNGDPYNCPSTCEKAILHLCRKLMVLSCFGEIRWFFHVSSLRISILGRCPTVARSVEAWQSSPWPRSRTAKKPCDVGGSGVWMLLEAMRWRKLEQLGCAVDPWSKENCRTIIHN